MPMIRQNNSTVISVCRYTRDTGFRASAVARSVGMLVGPPSCPAPPARNNAYRPVEFPTEHETLSCTVMAGLCPEGTFVRNVMAVTEALGQAVATVL